MKHIIKIILLFLALIFCSAVYAIGRSNELQMQVDTLKVKLEYAYQELADIKGELSKESDSEVMVEIDNANNVEDIIQDDVTLNDIEDTISTNTNSNEIQNPITPDTEDTSVAITPPEPTNQVEHIYDDMAHLYYGRLYIPELNISVALYCGYEPYITDRIDSANIFFFGTDDGLTIADHNDQEFAKLLGVKTGMHGYIQNKYRGRIDIKCVDVFNGYNNGRCIVDENGVNAMNRAAYMMYTCRGSSTHVIIALWDIVKED